MIEGIGIALGIWLSAASVLQFYLLRKGYYIREPNKAIATLEFLLACTVLGFFVWRAIKFVRRGVS